MPIPREKRKQNQVRKAGCRVSMGYSRLLPTVLVMSLVAVLATVAIPVTRGYPWTETRALYLLSGIGQALAAVFALAFTVILVSAQLASRHSPRLWTSILNVEAACLSAFLGLSAILPFWFLTSPSPNRVVVALVLGSTALVWLISYVFGLPRRIAPENRIRELGREAIRCIERTSGEEPQAVKVLDDFAMSALASHDLDIFEQALQQLLRAAAASSPTQILPDPTTADKVFTRIETDLYLSAAIPGSLLHTHTVFTDSFRQLATEPNDWLVRKWIALLTSLHANLAIRNRSVASGDATVLLGLLGQELASAGQNRLAQNVIFSLGVHKALAEVERNPLLMAPATAALASIADSALSSDVPANAEITSQALAYDVAVVLCDLVGLVAQMEVQRPHSTESSDFVNYQIGGDILIEIGATLLQKGARRLALQVAQSIVEMERTTTVQLRGPTLLEGEGFSTTTNIRKTIVAKDSLRSFWQAVLYWRGEFREHHT